DGQLEFLGRIDQQVKIRGFRIEVGEIEAFLEQHAAVAQVAVVAREDVPGQPRLVAYVAPPAGSGRPNPGDLRRFLEERLPAHMVPSLFVPLDALPLSPTGKVDRRRLPAPETEALVAETAFEAPRTERERVLAAAWAKVLRVEKVGIHNNFFELGGDSILSIQIASRANQAGLRLTPRQIFENPT
ncbi:MAG: non-ribosomal peptide synthetase, partial [Acidobacteria bacterium]|nr:non-ribosomal peptide synthetase [Acidobacteriota bacterium]